MKNQPTHAFRKVLVANRGEIARRIFRSLREMGIPSVAVFSDADENAPHTQEADEAVRIGPAPSAESYLNQQAIFQAARAVEADAIHPGYGFLAENASLAERCDEENITFVGPSAEAIRQMGDKAKAKEIAAKTGIPLLDGFSLDDLDPDTLVEKIKALGFPVLIKAVAGGGGKGMRVVRGEAELKQALVSAAREAEAAFGSSSLLTERFLTRARHVEVQILGDAYGGLMHLFERDCSVQRRHQKVFEECPSPAVGEALRQRMGQAAVELARAVDYQGAGTVEFLLDANHQFYFLEMNTRLQVEHPVTEAVTGLDLVRLQIEIAQGRPLPFARTDLELDGHAIEARLYAEDPEKDFLPVTGKVALWSPPDLPGLRIDSGVERGSEISAFYDPMLAKVIAHGRDRAEALRRLRRGLSELAVGGLITNRNLLLAVLENDRFVRGDVDTHFLDQLPAEDRTRREDPAVLQAHAIAATLFLFQERRQRPSPVPRSLPSGWRNHRWRQQEQAFTFADQRLAVRYVAHADDRFSVDATVDGKHESTQQTVSLIEVKDDRLILEIDGIRRSFRVARHPPSTTRDLKLSIHGLGQVSDLMIVPRFPETAANAVAGGCVAPMTGKVVEIRVEEGDAVERGDVLLVLEAMKMEHRLQAQAEGIVESVRVSAGQMVDPDQILVIVSAKGNHSR